MIPNPFAALDLTRWLVWGVAIASAVSVIWMHGYFRGERKLFEYQAAQATAAVPVVVMQGKVTERVVTKYRDRIVEVKGATEVITKEINVYVPASADCVLARGWVQLHDAAAAGAVPEPAGGADAAAPALASSQALKGVVENYGACRENSEQLFALQEWLRHQYLVMNQRQLPY